MFTSIHGRSQVMAGLATTLVLLATAVPAQAAHAAAPSAANAVERWNQTAGEAALAACLAPANNPLHESRMYAMTSLAVHDALNTVQRRYRTFAPPQGLATNASADVAVAAAARTVLVATIRELPAPFTDCSAAALAVVDTAYATALQDSPDGLPEDRGIAVGTAAGQAILANRAGDGSDTPLFVEDYAQGTEPGQWRFTPDRPFAFAPGWASVKPFALRGEAAFHVAQPYPLTSAAYARDFDEVKSLGGDGVGTPSARTADQTEAARFWLESSPLQWNRIARNVAIERGLDEWRSARLFALLNVALADGYVASWAVKYDDPFWRPVTAIREAATDGNDATTADPAWTPLDTTPPIPDHDSAHAVQGAAAATVMARVFGTDDVPFSTCSLTLPDGQQCDDPAPTLRRFASFSQAAQENADSRVWVGYHFRHASEVGLGHGRQVATLVIHDLLKPMPGTPRVAARANAWTAV